MSVSVSLSFFLLLLTHPFTHPPTHPLTHSPTDPLTPIPLPTHSLTHALTHLLTHSRTHSSSYSCFMHDIDVTSLHQKLKLSDWNCFETRAHVCTDAPM